MDNLLYLGIGYLGAGIGAGLCVLGAGLGIGKLASACLEGTARQPEAVKDLRTLMIISAALIEGIGFFALVICLLVALNTGENNFMPKAAQNSTVAVQAVQPVK